MQKFYNRYWAFPEEYQAKELAGKAAVFKCTVHEIKVRELPELDDEFASDVSECETLDAYKAEVKKKIKERKEREGKEKKENQAVDAAIENAQKHGQKRAFPLGFQILFFQLV